MNQYRPTALVVQNTPPPPYPVVQNIATEPDKCASGSFCRTACAPRTCAPKGKAQDPSTSWSFSKTSLIKPHYSTRQNVVQNGRPPPSYTQSVNTPAHKRQHRREARQKLLEADSAANP